jgi:NADH-quinone oxidoreductase subunit L
VKYSWAIFLPLLGFLITGIFGHKLGRVLSHLITTGFMGVACVISWDLFIAAGIGPYTETIPLFTWFDVGHFKVTWSIHFDTLSAVMVMVVNTISFLVHVYSIGYMHHDKTTPRFMAYLSLFTFMMLMLVTANNLVQLFFGWEGVGLLSYLLIGYWYERPAANAAAIKAFVMNRIGDLGLVLGLGGLFLLFQSVDIQTILLLAQEYKGTIFTIGNHAVDALEIITLLLFIGAMGKSAQVGLHVWLPDAMEGPTPVSALIHAATMVTAGVFLVVRLSPLYELAPFTCAFITVVGSVTAFFAATVATTQNDIKRIIAYSTCSQLGYMFFAAGLSAYHLAIFHLVTHAFFKALLFLGAGSVIHAMSDEQDIRKMGGIWRAVPITYSMMWIGSLALAGIPFFAGYYSKDAILEAACLNKTGLGYLAFSAGITAAFLTAFYAWRLIYMVFTGTPRADERVMGHLHEPGMSMLVPLVVLALGATFGGFIGVNYFTQETFWSGAITFSYDPQHKTELLQFSEFIQYLPFLVSMGGIALATGFYWYRTSLPEKLSQRFSRLYQFLLNKWYIDELYAFLFVKPVLMLGEFFWQKGDRGLIDRYGPEGVASWANRVARRFSLAQSGYLYYYALIMVTGVVIGVAWVLLIR